MCFFKANREEQCDNDSKNIGKLETVAESFFSLLLTLLSLFFFQLLFLCSRIFPSLFLLVSAIASSSRSRNNRIQATGGAVVLLVAALEAAEIHPKVFSH